MSVQEARKIVIDVPDMSCGHCVSHVEKALVGVAGVREVTVSLDSKTAEVTAGPDVSFTALEEAIDDAGYTASSTRDA